MKKKVFITGGKGMLASALESFYDRQGYQVLAPTHKELDVLDIKKLENAVSTFKPDLVFHTAALHVNDCEDNPELAFRLNSAVPVELARICSINRAIFVYISSCGYFGDEVKYYSEEDPVVLKTVYARSKYEGESISRQECKDTFAIRPGWLFGGTIEHKKNFVYQRYLDALKSPVIKSANDKFGCPTLVDDLVEKTEEIINSGSPGIYHVTNSGGASRADYVKKILRTFGVDAEVESVDSSFFPRKANVPNSELLDNSNLRSLGLSVLHPWEDAIERYIKTIKT